MSQIVLRSKDPLNPHVLVREGTLNALWDGTIWQRITAEVADGFERLLHPVRGTNVQREIVLRARKALNFWD